MFDASTVLLLRDHDGLEVFMLERHIESDFVGGAYVFPGGKVDQTDAETDRWQGLDIEAAADQLFCKPDQALALYVAAVRETFEEAGVLLAHRAGRPIEPGFLDQQDTRQFRERMASRGEKVDWRPWLEANDLVLDLSALHFWAWWVTPEGMPKRFDTRFFVAQVPAGQLAEHDGTEATDSRWVAPSAALAANSSGEVQIILPTRRNLVDLGQFPTVEAVLRDARGRNPSMIMPQIVPFRGGLGVDHESFEGPERV